MIFWIWFYLRPRTLAATTTAALTTLIFAAKIDVVSAAVVIVAGNRSLNIFTFFSTKKDPISWNQNNYLRNCPWSGRKLKGTNFLLVFQLVIGTLRFRPLLWDSEEITSKYSCENLKLAKIITKILTELFWCDEIDSTRKILNPHDFTLSWWSGVGTTIFYRVLFFSTEEHSRIHNI